MTLVNAPHPFETTKNPTVILLAEMKGVFVFKPKPLIVAFGLQHFLWFIMKLGLRNSVGNRGFHVFQPSQYEPLFITLMI